ncbi:MipA/OmpV family protein [Vibrio rhodolitus]|uniref:MipA/OmpV family protein n=1 Tax=Vibrio rhodolitus TaxID=2231649 RepID=UPI000E0B0C1A|nr:MipA/OmpV family protein [Vibrio rhodolitus]
MKTSTSVIIGLGLLLSSGAVYSQAKYKNFSFVGAGVTSGQSVFSDQGARVGVDPYLFHNSDYGFIDGSLANYSILPWLGISGNIRLSEVSDDFDDIPSGIDDRDSSAEVGVTLGTVGARITYLHDVSNKHDGYEVQLHLGRAFETPLQQLTVSPFVQVNYRDNKLSQHIYNVSASESSASGLAEFEADSTWVYETGVIALYDITDSLLGISKLEFEHHASESPLIQNDIGWKLGVGVVYQF